MIEKHGAVSSEVAVALAEGIRKRCGSTLGIGITGVAGPAGGTPEKPVGLVFIALAGEKGTEVAGEKFSRRSQTHPLFRQPAGAGHDQKKTDVEPVVSRRSSVVSKEPVWQLKTDD